MKMLHEKLNVLRSPAPLVKEATTAAQLAAKGLQHMKWGDMTQTRTRDLAASEDGKFRSQLCSACAHVLGP